jgi:hypothetical protein
MNIERLYLFERQDGDSDVVTITYGELDRRARAIGAWLESFMQAVNVHCFYTLPVWITSHPSSVVCTPA